MYLRVLQFPTVVASEIVLASCATYTAAEPGISPDEERVLVANYYWQAGAKPPQYTPQQVERVLRASDDSTLDGEYAEAQMSRVAIALASAGDDMFSQVLAREPETVKRAVARDLSFLWQRFGLHYPKTQHALQPYT